MTSHEDSKHPSTDSPAVRPHANTVQKACSVLADIAPLRLAQSWDNVGLLAGDPAKTLTGMMLCVDLTAAVLEETIEAGCDFVMAYHPPIFKPVSRLVAGGQGTDALVFNAISRGVAIYSMHTAFDAAAGGPNDVLASLCGIAETAPFEYVSGSEDQCKMVVFVPPEALDRVSQSLFQAGAGRIGDYQQCSFRLAGRGTFYGTESTAPVVGRKGRLEEVDEVRLEVVAPQSCLPRLVTAIRQSHPYEEPAFDVYPLLASREKGIGRIGRLPAPTTLAELARRLTAATGARHVQCVRSHAGKVSRAAICVGSAGHLPFSLGLGGEDVLITGEIRHHDALSLRRTGCSAIALGHWASERPVLLPLAERLTHLMPGLPVKVSETDSDPFESPEGL